MKRNPQTYAKLDTPSPFMGYCVCSYQGTEGYCRSMNGPIKNKHMTVPLEA